MADKGCLIDTDGRECARCGIYKSWVQFNKHKNGTRGHHPWCKECMRVARGQKARQKSLITDEGRVCTSCRMFKPWSEYRKHSLSSTGYQSQCKECMSKNYPYERKKHRGYVVRSKYGMEQHEYQEMLQAQGGVCAICGNAESSTNGKHIDSLAVDHDHKTGSVRGLLCRRCNTLLGFAQDDIEILQRAIDYLSKVSI